MDSEIRLKRGIEMKRPLWQFVILCLLATASIALGTMIFGSILTGDATDAARELNSVYEQIPLTPAPPMVYPASFKVCRAGVTETITVPDDLQWNYQVLLANEEAQKGKLYFGDCQ